MDAIVFLGGITNCTLFPEFSQLDQALAAGKLVSLFPHNKYLGPIVKISLNVS